MSRRSSTTSRILGLALMVGAPLVPAAVAGAGSPAGDGQGRSLMAQTFSSPPPRADGSRPHALLDMSLFAIAPPDVRTFHPHDLIQIIVRETSRAESSHDLETDKDYRLRGEVKAFPRLSLGDLLEFQQFGGRTDNLPKADVRVRKNFDGEGDYRREDDLTARLAAEVIEILPNGNLVLEAQTSIKTDDEVTTIHATGICRPDDVTAANTVLSSQIHDLTIKKINTGELKKTNERGILAKILDAIFAF